LARDAKPQAAFGSLPPMNDDLVPEPTARPAEHTLGASTIYRLCEEVIALRERNDRRHLEFEKALAKARDDIKAGFNSFAADTQRAYQQLRQEIHGEKRVALALLNELLDVALELRHVAAARPAPGDPEALARWADAVEVQARKVEAALTRHGIHPYDAVLGAPYNPALHERVGGKRVEGMGPLLVAEQTERGYASQQPEFVLRRPRVLISE
jgi:molecular chaperone GrpE (heat shock protein)